jgi:sterol desaturase/sphingolipid hydroxylase (fatty acid hydroxylase superfamily)
MVLRSKQVVICSLLMQSAGAVHHSEQAMKVSTARSLRTVVLAAGWLVLMLAGLIAAMAAAHTAT